MEMEKNLAGAFSDQIYNFVNILFWFLINNKIEFILIYLKGRLKF